MAAVRDGIEPFMMPPGLRTSLEKVDKPPCGITDRMPLQLLPRLSVSRSVLQWALHLAVK